MEVALNRLHRGFIAINTTTTDVNSKLAKVTKPDQSESFMVMREDPLDSPLVTQGDYLAGSNQWSRLERFRESVIGYHDTTSESGLKLVGLAASALNADAESLVSAFRPTTTWLRLLYYPSAPRHRSADLYGSAPLPSCIKPGETPRFAPIRFTDFLEDELRAGYQQHQKI